MPRVKIPVPAPITPQPPVQEVTPAPVAAPAPTPAPIVAVATPIEVAPVIVDESAKPPMLTRHRVIGGILVVGFVVILAMLFSVMHDRNKLENQVTKLSGSPSGNGAQQVSDLTKAIGAVFQLPVGETPTLATVSDASKVRSQAFFKDAQNGDKVLLYSKAGEAILYRTATKKIISVAPVNLNGAAASATSSTTAP